jgi:hypothetical protein
MLLCPLYENCTNLTCYHMRLHSKIESCERGGCEWLLKVKRIKGPQRYLTCVDKKTLIPTRLDDTLNLS